MSSGFIKAVSAGFAAAALALVPAASLAQQSTASAPVLPAAVPDAIAPAEGQSTDNRLMQQSLQLHLGEGSSYHGMGPFLPTEPHNGPEYHVAFNASDTSSSGIISRARDEVTNFADRVTPPLIRHIASNAGIGFTGSDLNWTPKAIGAWHLIGGLHPSKGGFLTLSLTHLKP